MSAINLHLSAFLKLAFIPLHVFILNVEDISSWQDYLRDGYSHKNSDFFVFDQIMLRWLANKTIKTV